MSAPADLSSIWRQQRDAHLEFFPDAPFDPSSILVKWSDDSTEELRAAIRLTIGGQTLQTWELVPGLEHMFVPGNAEDAVKLVDQMGGALGIIDFVEPDYFYSIIATPNDTYYGLLWGLNNTGQTVNGDPGTAGADIDANLAWDVTTGSSAVVVGMADSGIRRTHEDLSVNIWSNPGETAGNKRDDDGNGLVDDTWGWDFWNNDNDPTDDNGHGTHTAGTVGAAGNNGKGVTGVCWHVRMVALKIGSRTGAVSSSAGISAINYCVNKGIKVSNHSWGGTSYSSAFDSAVTSARNAGHMLVCAAGNSSVNNDSTPFYPASYPQDNVISVASIDNDDKLSTFSNYGATRVDLGAPGTNIASTYINRNANNAYAYLSGTSMAAPHVTGVAALVWSVNPDWSYAQVRDKILTSVRPISALSGKTVTGGVLNANNAVR
ncbi:MAG: S8 family serine peptidase [Phycisphaeraceae bacterium]|nr:S8 family serine peptidase [Phycisphaeraceae bacterium]